MERKAEDLSGCLESRSEPAFERHTVRSFGHLSSGQDNSFFQSPVGLDGWDSGSPWAVKCRSFIQDLAPDKGQLVRLGLLVVRFGPSQAPGCARGLGLVSCGARQTKRSAHLEWRTPKRSEERQFEGGRHGGKADSDHQISLSISVDFQ